MHWVGTISISIFQKRIKFSNVNQLDQDHIAINGVIKPGNGNPEPKTWVSNSKAGNFSFLSYTHPSIAAA